MGPSKKQLQTLVELHQAETARLEKAKEDFNRIVDGLNVSDVKKRSFKECYNSPAG
ncbi:MAG: hypothetical protein GX089_14595 [Fibrobacter sp.]|jgi:hypothetical protein|nr:hypothetical protein [Fibrobacter sp.]